jgi:hypothetical protein
MRESVLGDERIPAVHHRAARAHLTPVDRLG